MGRLQVKKGEITCPMQRNARLNRLLTAKQSKHLLLLKNEDSFQRLSSHQLAPHYSREQPLIGAILLVNVPTTVITSDRRGLGAK